MIHWASILALVIASISQDSTKPRDWSGSVTSTRADAFPKGTMKAGLRFGLMEQSEAWSRCWKRLDDKEPKLDFKSHAVLFVIYEKWPGALKMGRSSLKDGVLTIEVAVDEDELKEDKGDPKTEPTPRSGPNPAPKCHYDYRMRQIARESVKQVRLVHDREVLGQWTLAKTK